MNKKILTLAVAAAASLSFGFITWSGANGDYRVETEFDDGSDTYGYWYPYDDANNSGTSTLTWPCATGNEYDDNALDPIIDQCGGLCGDVSLGDGYEYPFVGVGFNVSGADQLGNDVTSWGGISIVYTSEIAATLEVAPQDEATTTEYNNYAAKLPASASANSLQLDWSKFKQESGWGVKVDQATYLTMVAAVKVKFAGTAGTAGHFNIISIGPGSAVPGIKGVKSASSVKATLAGRTLNVAGIKTVANVEVINLQGQIVKKAAVSSAASLDLAALDAGVYMVRVSGQSVDFSQKILLK
ncbi:MAG: T9SS type A sorting domain-containing protein [Fibrobacteraceae bacterium]|nr:T9SS type A sorting domain-containing protein [Fibrobacteraceae bacterium]